MRLPPPSLPPIPETTQARRLASGSPRQRVHKAPLPKPPAPPDGGAHAMSVCLKPYHPQVLATLATNIARLAGWLQGNPLPKRALRVSLLLALSS